MRSHLRPCLSAWCLRADLSAAKAAMHASTLSLRYQLKGKIDVLEVILPYVQTDLGPTDASLYDLLSIRETFRRCLKPK